jgi:hypothetical protein
MIITTLSTITGIILLAIFGITTPLQSADGKLTPDKVEFTRHPRYNWRQYLHNLVVKQKRQITMKR